MINYFLTEKENYKLQIFQYIFLSPYPQTYSTLLNKFLLKPFTLRRYVRELKDDISSAFSEKVELREKTKYTFTVINDPELSINFLITTLRLYYVKNSSLYLVARAISFKSYSSITELSHDTNLSEITIYKLIAQLKPVLSAFAIDICFEGRANLIGDELGARYFIFLLHWNLSSPFCNNAFTSHFPPEFTDINFLTKSLGIKKELSSSQTTKLLLMSGITSYRLVYFKKRSKKNKNLLEEIQYFYNGVYCLNLSSYNVSDKILEDESLIFSFLIRGLIYDFDTFENKRTIVMKYRSSHLPVARFVADFLKKFRKTFNLEYSSSGYIKSYYLLLITYLHIKYFYFDLGNYMYNPIKDNLGNFEIDPDYINVRQKLIYFVNMLPFKHPMTSEDEKIFSYLLYILYKTNNNPTPISIYITHTSNIANAALIKNTLRKIFNEDMLKFSDNPSESYLIISDTFEQHNSSENIFYLDDVSDKTAWVALINFIATFLSQHI